jgi:peroxiredoxin
MGNREGEWAMREIADEVLLDDTGKKVELGTVWRERPTAVVFLRHFGCTFCREHTADIQERYDEIEEAGGGVVAIGMGTPAHAAEFRRMSGIEFPLLVSPDTSLHRSAGLAHGWGRVLASLPRAITQLPKHGAKITGADMSQLAGTFVIVPGGDVVYAHRAKTASDNAPIDDVIGAIRSVGATAEPVRR